MNKRPRHRVLKCPRKTMLETLELRRLLSMTLLPSLPLDGLHTSISVAPASADLTAGSDGTLWFRANNTVEHIAFNGQVQVFGMDGGEGTGSAITSNLGSAADGGVLFAMAGGEGSRVMMVSGAGEFSNVSAVSPQTIFHVAAGGGRVWFTRGDLIVERPSGSGDGIAIDMPGVAAISDLTSDWQGNAWFSGRRSGGDGIIGRVTGDGQVMTFDVGAQPTEIVAAGNGVVFSDHDAVWKMGANGTVTRISLPGTEAEDLTAAPDGSVWFIDAGDLAAPVVRIGRDGSIARFATGLAECPNSLAVTPDGNVWMMAAGSLAVLQGNEHVATVNAHAMSVNSAQASGSVVIVLAATEVMDAHAVFNSNAGSTQEKEASPEPELAAAPVIEREAVAAARKEGESVIAPSRSMGDPGVFEGEFAVGGGAPIPVRETTFSSRRSLSSGGGGKQTIIPQGPAYSVLASGDGNERHIDLIEGRPAPALVAAALPQYVAYPVGTLSEGMGQMVLRVSHDLQMFADDQQAVREGDEAVSVRNDAAQSWWHLMVYMSVASFDLGNGDGRKYFRL